MCDLLRDSLHKKYIKIRCRKGNIIFIIWHKNKCGRNVVSQLLNVAQQRCYSPVASYNSTLLQCREHVDSNVATVKMERGSDSCHNVNVFVGMFLFVL